jgi:hypothetical protein
VTNEEQGRVVAARAITAARELFGDSLLSAFLIGSLAHGGFVAEVSDVDVAFVLGDDVAASSRMRAVTEAVLDQDQSALAERLSVFWCTAGGLREGRPTGRLPAIDWLDLLESGVLVHGAALPSDVPRPRPDQLVEDTAEFAVEKWRRDPDWDRRLLDAAGLVDAGRRAASKAALFPVRFLYTLATGRAGGTEDAVAWYTEHDRGPSRELVEAAHEWRLQGFSSTSVATELLSEQLAPLYRQFEREFRPRLVELGRDQLATALTATIARLERPS